MLVHRMLDACISARELSRPSRTCCWILLTDTSANPNEVKFHMDRDQVAKCAQQCNMKKRMFESQASVMMRLKRRREC